MLVCVCVGVCARIYIVVVKAFKGVYSNNQGVSMLFWVKF